MLRRMPLRPGLRPSSWMSHRVSKGAPMLCRWPKLRPRATKSNHHPQLPACGHPVRRRLPNPYPPASFFRPQECRKTVSPTSLARSDSDSLQVAAVGEDLGRGGHDPVGTRNWAAVQQGQREGTRTGAREHRGPAVLPRLPGASHQDVRRVRKLPDGGPSVRREPPDAHVRGHLTVQGTCPVSAATARQTIASNRRHQCGVEHNLSCSETPGVPASHGNHTNLCWNVLRNVGLAGKRSAMANKISQMG